MSRYCWWNVLHVPLPAQFEGMPKKYKMVGMAKENFPALPAMPHTLVKIPAAVLESLIAKTTWTSPGRIIGHLAASTSYRGNKKLYALQRLCYLRILRLE